MIPAMARRNLLPFPKPRVETPASPAPIICQIGSDRFAIHFQIEDLPPVPPVIPIQKKKAKRGDP